jgi:hypothetical protein
LPAAAAPAPTPTPARIREHEQDEEEDVLLQEVQQYISQHAWSMAAPEAGTGAEGQEEATDVDLDNNSGAETGNAALLTDLGQVLFAAHCVQAATARIAATALACAMADTGASTSGNQAAENGQPSSMWGGVAAALRSRYSSDPALLSSTLELAEGLLEFAQEENLANLTACLVSAKGVLSQKLAALQQQPSSSGTTNTGESSTSAGSEAHQQVGPKQQSKPHAGQQDGKQQQQGEGSLTAEISSEVVPGTQPSSSTPSPPPALVLSTSGSCDSGSGIDTPNSMQESFRAFLTGFKPREVERQYATWASVCCTRLMNYWRPIILGYLGFCMVQSLMEGRAHIVSHLIVHLLLAAPNAVGMLLAWTKQYRWVLEQ